MYWKKEKEKIFTGQFWSLLFSIWLGKKFRWVTVSPVFICHSRKNCHSPVLTHINGAIVTRLVCSARSLSDQRMDQKQTISIPENSKWTYSYKEKPQDLSETYRKAHRELLPLLKVPYIKTLLTPWVKGCVHVCVSSACIFISSPVPEWDTHAFHQK